MPSAPFVTAKNERLAHSCQISDGGGVWPYSMSHHTDNKYDLVWPSYANC